MFLRNGSTNFIIALSIPISIIATFGVLFFNHISLNQMSFGGLALGIGLIVDNSIVLVDYINLMRREQNLAIDKAVIESGRRRLRPILMTTGTTVLGMLPLAFGAGGEIQAALARSVIGGLMVSTMITLILIPVAYISFYSIFKKVKT